MPSFTWGCQRWWSQSPWWLASSLITQEAAPFAITGIEEGFCNCYAPNWGIAVSAHIPPGCCKGGCCCLKLGKTRKIYTWQPWASSDFTHPLGSYHWGLESVKQNKTSYNSRLFGLENKRTEIWSLNAGSGMNCSLIMMSMERPAKVSVTQEVS